MLTFRSQLACATILASLGTTHVLGAAESGPRVGDAHDALPGVHRVPIVGEPVPRVGVALDAGYGFTEAIEDEGSHHRILGSFALGVAPLSWLELSLRGGGRHDRHPEDDRGSDSGTTSDLDIAARFGGALGGNFRLGFELKGGFLGADALGDSLANPVLGGRLIAGHVSPGFAVSGYGGYRLDLSEGTAEDADLYRLGDRIALGVSEFDAVTVGVGTAVPLGPVSLLGEASADILIGSGAPSISQSPLRAAAGLRIFVASSTSLDLLFEGALGSRPDVGPGEALVPIEPRLTATLGFRHRFLDGPPPVAPPPPPPPKVEAEPEKKPPPPPPEPEAIPTNHLRVTVVDQTGHPLSDAQVELSTPEGVRALDFVEGSTFEARDVQVGQYELLVTAERLKNHQQTVTITEGEPIQIEVSMLPAAETGQLRGLVRSFDGQGIRARVTVEPGEHHVEAGADGAFTLDVPPGSYTIRIEAEGYATQKRKVKVGRDGVVVLNVDMQRVKP